MLGQFIVIGPGKKVANFIKSYLRYKEVTKPMGNLVAIVLTEPKELNLEVPQYASLEEALNRHNINTVINLETNPDFILKLRKMLPPHIQLSENSPSFAYLSLFLAKNIYQKKVAKKESFLSQILEASPFATVVFNRKGEVIYWNKACESLTGVPKEKVLGKKEVGFAFYELEKPLLAQNLLYHDLNTVKKIYLAQDPSAHIHSIPKGIIVSGFWDLRSKLKGFYQVVGVKLTQGKKILGSLEIIQNIGNIYELKSQVKEYQELLENLLNHIPYPLIYSTQKGHILYINAAAKKLFQKKLDKDKKHNIQYLLNLSEQSYLSTDKKTFNLEINQEEWEITSVNLREKGILWLFRNLTEQESKAKLSLILSVTGAICHELAQPLTAVVNASQLLSKTPADKVERIQRHQEIISKEGQKLFNIYTKLRNIEKVSLLPYLRDTQILDINKGTTEILNKLLTDKGEESGT